MVSSNFVNMKLCEISLEKYVQGETFNTLVNRNTVRIQNAVHEHAYKLCNR